MKIFFVIAALALTMLLSCKTKKSEGFAPGIEDYFKKKLAMADSSIVVESFEFIRLDTLHEKWEIKRQLFPFQRDSIMVSKKLDSLTKKIGNAPVVSEEIKNMLNQLQDEKLYLSKELDSLRDKLKQADTILPVGFIAHYLFSIRGKQGSLFTDTIGYAFDKKLQMIDWDYNNERNIDSISINRRAVLR